jgi:sulfate adenylyltransferase
MSMEEAEIRRRQPVELLASDARAQELKREALHLPSWDLSYRQVGEVELLLSGACSPLRGFLGQADSESVYQTLRLADGTLWPMPLHLDVTEAFAVGLCPGDRVALRHPEGMVLAILTVEDVWTPDREQEALALYGTGDERHAGVFQLLHETGPVYVGGRLEGLELPIHHTFKALRLTPRALRQAFEERGWSRILAFHTPRLIHRAEVEQTRRAAEQVGAGLLIQPAVGRTSPDDLDYFCRVRCYQRIVEQYDSNSSLLNILPVFQKSAGSREILWHALLSRNCGCTHFLVERECGEPGEKTESGSGGNGNKAAWSMLKRYEDEIGIEMVASEELVYLEDEGRYVPRSEAREPERVPTLSREEVERRLRTGAQIPGWYSYPEVIAEFRRVFPPRHGQGFTVFFTGLSGSGKSTLANVLVARLLERGGRPVTLLDGDLVRKNLSSELGFSRAHRDLNILRIGFVASEIVKNHGIAVCAPIAPYRSIRRQVRESVARYGGFIEVHVATPLEVCEQRDRKGLYAKARAGLLKNFTGIDDPYETPEQAELTMNTTSIPVEEAVERIVQYLEMEGYLEIC